MKGSELIQRRVALGMTRPELAAKFGCTPGLIDVWENAAIAGAEHPQLVELAMDQIEYLATAKSDEEHQAILQRAAAEADRLDRVAAGKQ